MLLNKIFICDELLTNEVRSLLNITPINEVIAELYGKLYKTNQMILIDNKATTQRSTGHSRILGAICEFNEENMPRILDRIDSYKNCSLSRIGLFHPHDITHRQLLQVYPIQIGSIHDLQYYKYNYLESELCWVYLANVDNSIVLKAIRGRRKRVQSGIHQVGFTELLHRKNLL